MCCGKPLTHHDYYCGEWKASWSHARVGQCLVEHQQSSLDHSIRGRRVCCGRCAHLAALAASESNGRIEAELQEEKRERRSDMGNGEGWERRFSAGFSSA